MTQTRSAIGPGVLLVLATALISGVSTFVNFYAVKGTNSDAFVTMRNIVVAAAFVPIALLAARYLRSPALRPKDWGRLVFIGLVGGAIPFVLFFQGLQMAAEAHGAAAATFGYRTLFLMATVLGLVVLHERFHSRLVLAAGLLLVGNALLLTLSGPIWTNGTFYVLVATAMWAVEYTVSKHTLRDLSSATVALGRMGFGAVFLSVYLVFTAQWASVGRFSGAQWEWVFISAALLTAFVASWYAGLKRVDLGVGTSVLVLGFPITWLLGVVALGSPMTLGEAAGATAIAVGVVVAIGWTQFKEAGTFLADRLRLRTPSV
jgi:drug/metabolite transporter (DMT)-like permease